MTKVEKVKEIIKKHYVPHGIFSCENNAGDSMSTIYASDGLRIDVCFYYEYFEVFGLTDAEFDEVEAYYRELGTNSGSTG